MNWFSGIVLYAMIWFATLFLVLPFGERTQGEAGATLRGTHSSAPANPRMKRRLLITTVIGTIIWALTATAIVKGWISIFDFDSRWGYGSVAR